MQNYRKLSVAAIIVIVAVSLFAVYTLQFLKFDYDFEHFLPQNDPDTEFFLEYREAFESDNDFVLVAFRNDGSVFDQEFLKKVDAVSQQIMELPRIDTVITPTRLIEYRKNFEIPYLRYEDAELLPKDSARIYASPELVGNYFSHDGRSLLMLVKTEQFLSKEGCDEVAANLTAIMDGSGLHEFHMAGRAVGEVYYIELMEHELGVFILTSLALVVIFLIIAFRSFWAVWIPILVVALSIVWILATMTLTGKPLNFVQTMLPSIIFVVGMSDVVHIVSKYIEELRSGKTKYEAVRIAFREIGIATFFTSLTTAVGFFTLMFSTVAPVQDFGLFTGIGVFLAYILAYTLLPAVMILLPPPKAVMKYKRSVWNKWLAKMFLATIRHKGKILIGFLLLLVISVIGVTKVEVNNFLLEGLRNDNPLRQEFNYFEQNFAGVRPFEMAVKVKDTSRSVYDKEVLEQVASLQEYVETEYGAGSIMSLVTVVKVANRSLHGGDTTHFRIPDKESDLRQITKRLKNQEYLRLFVEPDRKIFRLGGRMYDIGWQAIEKRNEGLYAFFAEQIDTNLITYELTGTAVLIDKNNDYLSKSMIQSLSIAFIVVAFVVGLLFASVRMVLLALIPNILPLVVIGGVMGFAGMELKVINVLIFTIAFGIAVDDTIHFVSRLRLELKRGKSVVYAIKRTMLSTGKAIVVTSIILSAGFLTLLYSDFLGTFQTGLLIGITLLLAVLSDLLLLPVLILLCYKKR